MEVMTRFAEIQKLVANELDPSLAPAEDHDLRLPDEPVPAKGPDMAIANETQQIGALLCKIQTNLHSAVNQIATLEPTKQRTHSLIRD